MSEQRVADDFVGGLTDDTLEAASIAASVKYIELQVADGISKAASSEYLRVNQDKRGQTTFNVIVIL